MEANSNVPTHRYAGHRLSHRAAAPLYLNDDACIRNKDAVVEQSRELVGAPPWFQAWNNTQFLPFVAGVVGVEGSLTVIQRNVTTLLVRDSKDRNSKLGDDGPFYEVPFPDGRKPWGAVVAIPGQGHYLLPALTKATDLEALTLPESYGYYNGYFPNRPVLEAGSNTLAARIAEISVAIGRHP